jgi:hypothetical protein
MKIKYSKFLCLLFGVFCLLGCADSNLQISGKVTFEDGTPLTSGEVIFALEDSDNYFAKGRIGGDGNYTLSEQVIGKKGDPVFKSGCRKGEFKVFIASTSISQILDDGSTKTIHIIDQSYADKNKSPLRATVPGGNYNFKIPPHKM